MVDRVAIGVLAEVEMKMKLLVERVLDRFPVPLLGCGVSLDVGLDDLLDQRVAHVDDVVLDRRTREQFLTPMVHHLALAVHHVVVFEQMLADVEVVRLDLLLRVLDRLADPSMLDRMPSSIPMRLHQA